ncbi:MAG: choice-of-anchor D domain-containing protein [Bacteroidota bacterium]
MPFYRHYRVGWIFRTITFVVIVCSQLTTAAGSAGSFYLNEMNIASNLIDAAAGTPVFSADTKLISIGTIKLAAWKDTVVTVSNTGTDTLKISNIKSSKTYFTVRPALLTIPPGESRTDTIRFTADSIGTRSALIIFISNSSPTADTLKVNGFGSGTPKLVMSRISITFVSTKLGASARDTVKIQNKGTDTLKVTNIVPTNDAYSVTRTIAAIAPGKFITDTIWYRPAAIGTNAGKLLIESNDPTTPDTVSVAGFATGVPIFVSEAKIYAVGPVKLATWKDTVFTITNTGTDTLKIKTVTSSKTYFTARPTVLNIPPGMSKTDTLRFTADSIGTRSANILFASNDATTPDTIKVNGFGVGTPKLVMSRINMTLAAAKLSQSTRDTVKLQNKGTDTLKVTDIVSSDEAYTAARTVMNIAPGKFITDTIIFTPTAIGKTSAKLFIESNDATSPDTVSVSGFATGVPIFSTDAKHYAVGTVKLGVWKDTVLTITNTGTDTLKIKSVTSSRTMFALRPTVLNVPPGSSRTDTLRFTPDSIGTRNAVIIFTSNDVTVTDTLTVSGYASGTPRLVTSRANITFGSTKLTQTTRDTIKLQNKGTDTLKISSIYSSDGAFAIRDTFIELPPNGIITDSIYFTPSAIGTTSGQLIVVSNDASGFDTVNVSGFATGVPLFQADTKTLFAGYTKLGTWIDTIVTITNTGTDTLKIKSVTSGKNYFTVRPTVLTIAPGTSKTDTIRFTADSIGRRSTPVIFASNAPVTSDTIMISGFGVGTPKLVLSRVNISVASTKLTQTQIDTLKILNKGTDTLKIAGVTASNGVFVLKNNVTEIPPNGTVIDSIFFTPAVIGTSIGKFFIESNDPTTPDTVSVSGFATGYSGFSVSRSSVDMGRGLLNTLNSDTITFFNHGSDTLKITGITSGNTQYTVTPTTMRIPPSGMLSDTIKFIPKVIGSSSANIIITSNSVTSPDTVSVNGFGYGTPKLVLSRISMTMAVTKLTASTKDTVKLMNKGTDTLKVSNITASDGTFSVSESSMEIPPNGSMTDTVSFSPAVIGTTAGTLFISSNNTSSPDTIRVSGFATGVAQFSAETRSVSMGMVKLGTWKDTVVSISNTGTDTLKIKTITSSRTFFAARPAVLTIPPGMTKSDTLRFTADTIGTRSAFIVFTGNDPTSPDTIAVNGFGVGTPKLVLGRTNVIVAATKLFQTSLDTVKVFNKGTDTLKIAHANSSDAAYTITQSFNEIPPGGSIIDTITFTPSVIGTTSGKLFIASNDATSPDTVNVTGFASGTPIFAPDVRTIFTGYVKLNTWKDTILTISNPGSDTLKIKTITSSRSIFTFRPAVLTIAPGASKTDTIRFTADSIGTRSAAIIYSGNGAVTSDTIVVSGFGVGTPKLVLGRTSVVAATTKLFQTTLDTVKIINKGTDTLKIAHVSSSNAAYTLTQTFNEIAPGSFIIDTISFTPSVIGTTSGKLFIASNDLTSPDTVNVSGFALGTPLFSAESRNISIGRVQLNTWKDTVITISNPGSDTLKIKNVTSSKSFFTMRPAVLTVPPGTAKTDTIRFTADSIGTRSALVIYSGNGISPADTILVDGFGVGTPKLVLGRTSAAIAVTKLFQTTLDTVKVFNKGTDTLKIAHVSSSDTAFTLTQTFNEIPPGSSIIDTIAFTPSMIGTTSGKLFLASNDLTSPDTVNVTGFATGTPFFSPDVRAISLGKVLLNTLKDTVLTVSNTGTDTLKIKSITSSRSIFTFRPAVLTIPPGTSKTDTIRFTADSIGTRSAIIIYSANGIVTSDTILVNGFGIGTPKLVLSRTNIVMGTSKLFRTTLDTVKIFNKGTDTLKVTSLTSSDSAYSLSQAFNEIPPGGVSIDTISFTPSEIGTTNGKLFIASNDATTPDTVNVSGFTVGTPVFVPDTRSISFGRIKLNTWKDTILSISNTGTDTLKITTITPSKSIYTVRPAVLTIPPGFTKTDTIRFTADSIGTRSAMIIFSGNGAVPADTILVNGFGVGTPKPVMSRTTAVLSMTKLTTTSHDTVKILNKGTDTLKVTNISSTHSAFTVTDVHFEIPPNGTFIDTIFFAPSVIGTSSGLLLIESNAASTPDTVSVSGFGTGVAVFNTDANVVSMGTAQLGTWNETAVQINNTGTDTLKINSITPERSFITVRPSQLIIPPGESRNDTVRFTADSIGVRSANIIFAGSSLTSPDTLSVSGFGVGTPKLILSRSSITASVTKLTQTTRDTLRVMNKGTDTLKISAVSTVGSGWVMKHSVMNIPPNGSVTDTVLFTPEVIGTTAAKFLIESNDPTNPDTVNVSGFATGVSAYSVSRNYVDIGNAPVDYITSDTVTIRNIGTDTLKISSVISSNPLFTVSRTVMNIPPNGIFIDTVRLAPKVIGEMTTVLTITSNSPGSPNSITVRGMGTGVPVYAVSRTQLNFGNVDLQSMKSDTITFYNLGNDTLKISDVTSTSGVFTLRRTAMFIPPKSSATDTIEFAPAVIGNASGKFFVESNDASALALIKVSGYGVGVPILSLSRPELFQGKIKLEQVRRDTITIRNTGSDTLKISNIASSNASWNVSHAKLTIPPNKSAVDTVLFSPVAMGPLAGILQISSNTRNMEDTLHVSGAGADTNGAILILTNKQIEFGRLGIFQKKDSVITIGNDGVDTLRVQVTSTAPGSFTMVPAHLIVPPGQFKSDTIRMRADSIGKRSAKLIFSSNDQLGPDTMSVNGFVTGNATLVLSRTELNAGNVVLNTHRIDTITFHNSGNDTLKISNIISTNNSFVVTTSAMNIPPGRSVTDSVIFTPTAIGTTSGKLILASNDLTSENRIDVTGYSAQPEFASDQASLQFGEVGRTYSRTLPVKITNSSINLLSISSIQTATAEFTADRISGTVGADTLTILVTFHPVTTGLFSDTLFIANDSRTAIAAIPLAGMTPEPVLTVSDTLLQFVEILTGESVSSSVRIINTSISPLTIKSLSVGTTTYSVDTTGPAASTESKMLKRKNTDAVSSGDAMEVMNPLPLPDFSLPLTITNELKVRVWYAPKGFGQFTDTLTIRSDGGEKKVVLLGNSRRPALLPSAQSLSFGTVARHIPRTMELKITNSIVNKLTVDSIYTKTKHYSVNRSSGSVVQNDTLKLAVQFTADTFAVYIDTLYLRNNSANGLVKIPLSGESPMPVLALEQMPCGRDTVAVGDTCTKVFVIKNSSVNDLIYDTAATRTPSFVIRSAVSGVIKSNDSAVVTLIFTPKKFGEYADTLSVHSFGKVTDVPLSGISPYPSMVLSYTALDFGKVRKDTSAVRTLVVKNRSINALRIDSLSTVSKYFSAAKFASPVFVTQADSAVFSVTFSADTVRDYRDTLSIFTNQFKSIVFTPLSGNGVLTSIATREELFPKEYTLQQNYPNPFNPATTIRYGLPKNSSVTIKVYNILGQVVETLVEGEQNAGWQSVQWNAHVSSGMYIYRIEAVNGKERFVQVKKMMLLK